LNLYQSNRLEQLFSHLCVQLARPPADPLAPETIVVQHPAMGNWLAGRLAWRNSIAANIKFPLIARFIWDIFSSQMEDPGGDTDFSPPVLVWRIFSLLPEIAG